MADGLVVAAIFVIVGLSIIPIDRWITRRRIERRRNQAHRPFVRRARARWIRQ